MFSVNSKDSLLRITDCHNDQQKHLKFLKAKDAFTAHLKHKNRVHVCELHHVLNS